MKISGIAFSASLLAYVLCMSCGLWLQYGFFFEVLVAVSAAAWIFFGRKYPSCCLFFSVAIAASGLLSGAPAPGMLAGSIAALAVWDVASIRIVLSGNPAGTNNRTFLTLRLAHLCIASGVSLAVVLLLYGWKLFIPFYLLVAMIIGAAVCLLYITSIVPRKTETDGQK